MKLPRTLLAAALLTAAAPAFAQAQYPTAPDNLRQTPGSVAMICDTLNKNCAPVNTGNPLPVSGGGTTTDAAIVSVTPTVTASSAYASGNVIGTGMTFNVGRAANGNGTLVDAAVIFGDQQTQPMDLLIFSSAPSAVTDKTALSLSAADAAKLIRVIHLADYSSLGTPSIVEIHGMATKYVSDGSGNLYGILVSRGTPTFGTTNGVTVQLGVERNG